MVWSEVMNFHIKKRLALIKSNIVSSEGGNTYVIVPRTTENGQRAVLFRTQKHFFTI